LISKLLLYQCSLFAIIVTFGVINLLPAILRSVVKPLTGGEIAALALISITWCHIFRKSGVMRFSSQQSHSNQTTPSRQNVCGMAQSSHNTVGIVQLREHDESYAHAVFRPQQVPIWWRQLGTLDAVSCISRCISASSSALRSLAISIISSFCPIRSP
jgi:hypothetical protein